MKYRFIPFLSFILITLLAYPAHVFAQVDRAALTGVVRDSSGAIVPGALITLTPIAGGSARELKATDTGTYQATGLGSGEWLVEVAAAGFQTVAQTVRLEVGQRAQLDVTLPVGGVTERVLVEGVTPLLDTQSAVLGTVVSEKEIATLPLALRNWDDMLFLVPGVQGYRYTEESGGTSGGRTGGVTVHGHRSLQNNFLLDGVDNNSISTNVQELSTQISRPSIDAIGEFKVVTTPFTAEYGRAPGATISVTTRSGSNSLKGSGYYYFRDERFDANTFFANRSALPKPTNNQNQFGGSLGGPLRAGTAFFFADYEGTRITRGVLRTGTVPTADQRRGVFTSAIRDPLTGQNFANNTIPAQRIDPVAAAILALVPMPNAPGSSNFIRQPDITDDNDRFSGRLDLRASSSDNLFARYSYNKRFRFVPGFFGGLLDGTSTSAWGRNDLNSQSAVFGWTRVFGPSVVNEFRLAWAQGRSDGYQDPKGEDGMSTIGFTGVPEENRTGGIIGVNIQGLLRFGSPNFMPKYQHTDQLQFIDSISWLSGRHQFKFGAEIMAPMQNDYVDVPATRGDMSFNNNMFSGSALADFLLGYASSVQLSNFHEVRQRQHAYSFYLQDDWRATDRLTLNLGVRYDFMTPQMDADNRVANFDPATGQLYYAQDGSLEDRALVKPDRNNFGPRLGIVYKASNTTVVRGGYGIYYNLVERIGSEDQLSLNPPGLRNISITVPSGSAVPAMILRNGFPPNFLDVSNINYGSLLLRTAQRDGQNSMFHQVAIGVERQLSTSVVASADAIGSVGRNITLLRNLNQRANGNGARPYPAFGHIQYRDHAGTSRYRGLDLSLEKRFSRGHSYRVSYTFGDQRDNTPEHLSAASPRPQNTNDLDAWEAPGDNDIRHRLVGSFMANLPLGQNPILRDWLVAAILTTHTGRPFTVTQGSLEGAGWVPNRVADTDGPGTVDQWFNVSDFQVVPTGVFGDAGRNSLRGPGWFTLDFSLQRRIQMRNALAATLRYDVFNATNRTNFGNPNADITSASNRGTITSLAGDPRSMQFSVRLEF
jgi:outer membrane receptor protein involved in Fe transport